MRTRGVACCQRGNQRRGWAAGGALFAGLAVLTPKCPMCIAAWLGVLGLSRLALWADPRVLWLVAALAVAAASMRIVHRFSKKETLS